MACPSSGYCQSLLLGLLGLPNVSVGGRKVRDSVVTAAEFHRRDLRYSPSVRKAIDLIKAVVNKWFNCYTCLHCLPFRHVEQDLDIEGAANPITSDNATGLGIDALPSGLNDISAIGTPKIVGRFSPLKFGFIPIMAIIYFALVGINGGNQPFVVGCATCT